MASLAENNDFLVDPRLPALLGFLLSTNRRTDTSKPFVSRPGGPSEQTLTPASRRNHHQPPPKKKKKKKKKLPTVRSWHVPGPLFLAGATGFFANPSRLSPFSHRDRVLGTLPSPPPPCRPWGPPRNAPRPITQEHCDPRPSLPSLLIPLQLQP